MEKNSINNKNEHEKELSLIFSMINTAKGNLNKGSGTLFILWGYLVCATSLIHFLLLMFAPLEYKGQTGMIWLPMMLIGFIVTMIIVKKKSNQVITKTYIDTIVQKIWIGFMVALILIMILLNGKLGWYIYPSISFIYTFALYVSSVAYRIQSMLVAVVVCLICTITYKFVDYHFYPLLMAMVMICGNILPGYYLNYKAKQQAHV